MNGRRATGKYVQFTDGNGILNAVNPVAVIDIGSNSIRLVIYEGLNRDLSPLFNEKVLCGLDRGVARTGSLEEKAADRALRAIKRFFMLSEQANVSSVVVLATAAVREADNGPSFLSKVDDICGGKVIVLSGEEEARFSASGIKSGFRNPVGCVGDMGGGSLELVGLGIGKEEKGTTYPLGGIRLREVTSGSISEAANISRRALKQSKVLSLLKGNVFYAVGGTWRTLARLHMAEVGYPLRVMHNYRISGPQFRNLCEMVERCDLEMLAGIGDISKVRQALLPYGAAVLRQIIEIGEPAEIIMSALGVREGYLFELLSRDQQREDALILACKKLCRLRSRSHRFAEEIFEWSEKVYAVIGIKDTPEQKRLRRAACLISDMGWRAHPDYRGEQSLNVIAHAAITSIDHPGRAFLALCMFYRYEGISGAHPGSRLREIAGPENIDLARKLGSFLRLAYVAGASFPGMLSQMKPIRQDNRILLKIDASLLGSMSEKLPRRWQSFSQYCGFEGIIAEG